MLESFSFEKGYSWAGIFEKQFTDFIVNSLFSTYFKKLVKDTKKLKLLGEFSKLELTFPFKCQVIRRLNLLPSSSSTLTLVGRWH